MSVESRTKENNCGLIRSSVIEMAWSQPTQNKGVRAILYFSSGSSQFNQNLQQVVPTARNLQIIVHCRFQSKVVQKCPSQCVSWGSSSLFLLSLFNNLILREETVWHSPLSAPSPKESLLIDHLTLHEPDTKLISIQGKGQESFITALDRNVYKSFSKFLHFFGHNRHDFYTRCLWQ